MDLYEGLNSWWNNWLWKWRYTENVKTGRNRAIKVNVWEQ